MEKQEAAAEAEALAAASEDKDATEMKELNTVVEEDETTAAGAISGSRSNSVISKKNNIEMSEAAV
jgi:hypothetical protein